MKVYFDESGIHDGASVCAVAGYRGHENAWKEFDSDWAGVLSTFDVPEFHAKRFLGRDAFARRVSPYKHLSDKDAEEFLSALLLVIKRSEIYPIGCGIIGTEWNRLSVDERRYLTGAQITRKGLHGGSPRKSYYLPFLQSVYRAATYCKEDEIANFFFGLDRTFSEYALNYFKRIKRLKVEWVSRLGEISFPTGVTTTPLQASDLLAFEINRYAQKRLVDPEFSVVDQPTLMAALANLKSPDDDFKLFDRKGIDAALENLRNRFAL